MSVTANHQIDVGPGALKALAVIMDLASAGSVTFRKLAKTLGVTHTAAVGAVERLEKYGLVSRERMQCNTIRPLVKFIPCEQLGEL